MMAATPR